ncbi:glycosyltransferase [Breoghania sp. L-A4]|uniref:glycosyltransferase n=1 Tax=Breoghania sp. L-A4 TaxID=2304600 RepID=UPI0013C3631C|nr:glycosyltransferase [Breoghania sp. L-A4]
MNRFSVAPRLHACVDRCHTSPTTLTVRGWAFFEDAAMAAVDGVVLGRDPRRDSRLLSVEYGLARGDVRDILPSAQSQYCGFTASMPVPAFRSRSVQLVFTASDGRKHTVTARVRRAPVAWWSLAKAVWAELDAGNIRLAAGWILRGDFRRLRREIFGLLDSGSPPHKSVPLAATLERIAEPASFAPLDAPIDVIVPVYNGFDHLKPLFDSLRRNTSTPFRLLVIHDASPDPRIEPLLERLLDGFDNPLLLRNEVNLGFVRSVNRAVEHASNDFVLLNADTIVPPGWLERLMAPIGRDRTIASTTPFSNAATICSFPDFCHDNRMLRGESVESVDAAFGRIRPPVQPIELPTAIGFCMGVNRDVWRKIGPFDAEAFGLGYGEENDWCLRAVAAGHRNVLVENLFVQHEHGGSFEGETRQRLRQKNLRRVQDRHPGYAAAVDAFVKSDPPLQSRTIAALLIAGARRGAAPVLVIDHDLGGGATHYRDRLIHERTAAGQAVLLLHNLRGTAAGGFALRLYLDDSRFDLVTHSLDEIDRLIDDHVAVGEIFYNNLVSHGAPLDLVAFAIRLKQRHTARMRIAMHDFYPVCPAYTLLNKDGIFCGIPDLATCRACLPHNPYASNPQAQTIDQWREGWGQFFEAADEVVCFSRDSRTHLLEAYPHVAPKVTVQPHVLSLTFDRPPRIGSPDVLRIGVIGGISYQKGATVVVNLARHLRSSDPRAHITVIGVLNEACALGNLTVTGRYDPSKLPNLLEAHNINVCLLPSIWPETFSYVTAELMALSMPIVAFDIGAPAERLADYERARIIPIASSDDPAAIAAALRDTMTAMADPAPDQ